MLGAALVHSYDHDHALSDYTLVDQELAEGRNLTAVGECMMCLPGVGKQKREALETSTLSVDWND